MGQRSQIFVRYRHNKESKLIATHLQWNYGERMVSRARYTMEWLSCYSDGYANMIYLYENKLRRIIEVNFDMKDVVIGDDIVKYFMENNRKPDNNMNDLVFYGYANNDGRLFIDYLPDGKIKYAFTGSEFSDTVMDTEHYMLWNLGEDWRSEMDDDDLECYEKNRKWIEEHAELMTWEELHEFIADNYFNPAPFM